MNFSYLVHCTQPLISLTHIHPLDVCDFGWREKQAPAELREIVDGNLVKLNISGVEMDATSTSSDFQKNIPYVSDDMSDFDQEFQSTEPKAIRIFPFEIEREMVDQVIIYVCIYMFVYVYVEREERGKRSMRLEPSLCSKP